MVGQEADDPSKAAAPCPGTRWVTFPFAVLQTRRQTVKLSGWSSIFASINLMYIFRLMSVSSKHWSQHLLNTIFQEWCQSSQFFCYLKFLILCPLLSCWPPLKITWCELLVVSFLSSYVARVWNMFNTLPHLIFKYCEARPPYDILSALVMKHMARGVGIGRWEKEMWQM